MEAEIPTWLDQKIFKCSYTEPNAGPHDVPAQDTVEFKRGSGMVLHNGKPSGIVICMHASSDKEDGTPKSAGFPDYPVQYCELVVKWLGPTWVDHGYTIYQVRAPAKSKSMSIEYTWCYFGGSAAPLGFGQGKGST